MVNVVKFQSKDELELEDKQIKVHILANAVHTYLLKQIMESGGNIPKLKTLLMHSFETNKAIFASLYGVENNFEKYIHLVELVREEEEIHGMLEDDMA